MRRQPQVVGGVGRCARRGRSAGLQYEVERLGTHAPIGVEEHDDTRVEGEVMICPIAPPMAIRISPTMAPVIEPEPMTSSN